MNLRKFLQNLSRVLFAKVLPAAPDLGMCALLTRAPVTSVAYSRVWREMPRVKEAPLSSPALDGDGVPMQTGALPGIK